MVWSSDFRSLIDLRRSQAPFGQRGSHRCRVHRSLGRVAAARLREVANGNAASLAGFVLATIPRSESIVRDQLAVAQPLAFSIPCRIERIRSTVSSSRGLCLPVNSCTCRSRCLGLRFRLERQLAGQNSHLLGGTAFPRRTETSGLGRECGGRRRSAPDEERHRDTHSFSASTHPRDTDKCCLWLSVLRSKKILRSSHAPSAKLTMNAGDLPHVASGRLESDSLVNVPI